MNLLHNIKVKNFIPKGTSNTQLTLLAMEKTTKLLQRFRNNKWKLKKVYSAVKNYFLHTNKKIFYNVKREMCNRIALNRNPYLNIIIRSTQIDKDLINSFM